MGNLTSIRLWWCALLSVLLSVAVVSWYLLDRQLDEEVMAAKDKTDRSLHMMASLLFNSLREGRYQDGDELIRIWAEADARVRGIELVTANGFVVASFHRPELDAQSNFQLETTIAYGYRGNARLRITSSLADIYRNHRIFSSEIFGILAALAVLLVSLLLLVQMRQRQSERLQQALTRLRSLYDTAEGFSRATDAASLAEAVARDCVRRFKTVLVWIGLAQTDGSVAVLKHAADGESNRYMDSLNVRWDDSPLGRGPTGRAIATQQPQVAANIANDTRMLPWAQAAGDSHLRSSGAFPLVTHDACIGALNVYSDEADFFSPERVEFFTAYARMVAARLDNAMLYGQLQRNAEALERTVAERTSELVAKNRELETFTYSVSHDLKAPLRGIDGYSRLLASEYGDKLDQDGQFFVKTIRDATEQMGRLIDDLLAYSRLERRDMALAEIDPKMIADAVIAERSDEIRARSITVRVDVSSQVVSAEKEGLALAIRNVFDNALKFTRNIAAPSIELTSKTEGGKYVLAVRDNGPGFDMQYRDRIFEIFQRLHRAEEFPGTGIGLAIVRKAMERMHGRSWAESTPGQGATFFLEMPMAAKGET